MRSLALLASLLVGCSSSSRESPGRASATPKSGSTSRRASPAAKSPAAAKSPTPATPRGAGLALKVVETCTLPPDGAINTASNVVYGSAGQKLDIAWPKGAGPFPLVVLVHGGGWFSGDRSDLGAHAELLANAGYAAATISYRLAKRPRNLFPACVEDVRCAVRWLRGQARRFAIDPARVAVAGASAGGHLALMMALAENVAGLDGGSCPAAAQSARVSGAISFYGPTDLRDPGKLGSTEQETLPNLFGRSPEEAPALARLASPILHVTAKAPPILMIHGTIDEVVPISHARQLKGVLDAVGVPALLLEVPKQGHDFPLFSAKARDRRHTCTALAFFQTIFK